MPTDQRDPSDNPTHKKENDSSYKLSFCTYRQIRVCLVTCETLIEEMHEEAIPEFRFEPG